MSETTINSRGSLVRNIARVSSFQIKLLVLALAITLAGAAALSWHWVDQKDDAQHVETMPDDVRSVVESSGESNPDVKTTPVETWAEWFGANGVKMGTSFLGAFAIGFAFRTFIKTMTILAVLAVATLAALSYFRVYNIDFSAVERTWNSNSDWIITQATKLKDVLWTYLPSSTTGLAGLFVGMMRR